MVKRFNKLILTTVILLILPGCTWTEKGSAEYYVGVQGWGVNWGKRIPRNEEGKDEASSQLESQAIEDWLYSTNTTSDINTNGL